MEFNADRHFLFIIQDSVIGNILFVGKSLILDSVRKLEAETWAVRSIGVLSHRAILLSLGHTGLTAVLGSLLLVALLLIPLQSFLPTAEADSAVPLILDSPVVTNARSSHVPSPVVGQQLFLSTLIGNPGGADTYYMLLTEVRDESGVTIMLDSRWGLLSAGDDVDVHHAWRPEHAGAYEVRSFVISPECFPEVLTEVDIIRFVVTPPDGSEQLPPRLEYLTEEEIRQLTREEIEAIELEENRRSDIDSEMSDAETLRLEAMELRIREVIWSDERIKEYQRTMAVFSYDSDFVMDEQSLCDNAVMTIHVSKVYTVEGDWQTSYVSTLSGRLELKVSVVSGAIVSIVEHPLNDTVTQHVYSEEEKKVIRMVFADTSVQEFFQGIEVQVGGVRTGGVYFDPCYESCAIVVLHQKQDKDKTVVISLDVSNQRVISIRPSQEWLSEEP